MLDSMQLHSPGKFCGAPHALPSSILPAPCQDCRRAMGRERSMARHVGWTIDPRSRPNTARCYECSITRGVRVRASVLYQTRAHREAVAGHWLSPCSHDYTTKEPARFHLMLITSCVCNVFRLESSQDISARRPNTTKELPKELLRTSAVGEHMQSKSMQRTGISTHVTDRQSPGLVEHAGLHWSRLWACSEVQSGACAYFACLRAGDGKPRD